VLVVKLITNAFLQQLVIISFIFVTLQTGLSFPRTGGGKESPDSIEQHTG